jgi:hypothetical protein
LPAVLTILLAFSALGMAITSRHDRDDSKYLELGRSFPAVCTLGHAGDGILIAPGWVLTAAHVASGLQKRGQALTADFQGTNYAIAKVFIHPQWTEMGPHDVALLKLAKPVTGVAPIKLYTDADESGQIATIVGHGDTRSGKGGQWLSDGQARGATSKIERADNHWIYTTFDEPPAGTDLEGAPGRGDSGGPALLIKQGKPYVAGVSSLGTDGRNGPGTYGAEDSFVRISSYQDWIAGVLAGREKEEATSSKLSPGPRASRSNLPVNQATLPDTPEGKIVAAYIQSFNSGDEQNMRDFFVTNLSEEALRRRPLQERLQAYREMFGNLAGLELKRVLTAPAHSIAILVKRGKGEWQKFDFEFSTQPPYKLSGVANQTAEAQ